LKILFFASFAKISISLNLVFLSKVLKLEADLSEADLSKADLSEADFSVDNPP